MAKQCKEDGEEEETEKEHAGSTRIKAIGLVGTIQVSPYQTLLVILPSFILDDEVELVGLIMAFHTLETLQYVLALSFQSNR